MELLLEQLENLLGITESDPETDKKLMWILESSKARLKLLLGGIEPPEELNHIIIEVSVIRFNRIGSEGLTSHTVEGESQTWNDDDFSGFEDEIGSFLDTQTETKKGRVRFI